VKALRDLVTLLDMAPERARAEDQERRFPQLHLPIFRGRAKTDGEQGYRVLLLGGPLDRRFCRVQDASDPDIHIDVPGKVIIPGPTGGLRLGVTYWYRMRRVPLTGFSLFRSAFYVGVVGEVQAYFAPDLLVP